MIRNSPSQIYHSALPFSPSSSWLRESYKAELGEGVKILMGVPDKWDTCSRTISLDGQPTAFSHCRDIIAVGMGRSDVLLLDAIIGTKLFLLSGHTNEISSLAFSLDATILVSGSRDRTVKLWDVKTGGLIKTFDDHPFAVSSVAISPNCTTVASRSESVV